MPGASVFPAVGVPKVKEAEEYKYAPIYRDGKPHGEFLPVSYDAGEFLYIDNAAAYARTDAAGKSLLTEYQKNCYSTTALCTTPPSGAFDSIECRPRSTAIAATTSRGLKISTSMRRDSASSPGGRRKNSTAFCGKKSPRSSKKSSFRLGTRRGCERCKKTGRSLKDVRFFAFVRARRISLRIRPRLFANDRFRAGCRPLPSGRSSLRCARWERVARRGASSRCS